MFLTQTEITDTPNALGRTCDYFEKRNEEVKKFFAHNAQRKFAFVGCGSSHMLAKSAAALFASFPDTVATAIPAGDYIIDPTFWAAAVKESIVVVLPLLRLMLLLELLCLWHWFILAEHLSGAHISKAQPSLAPLPLSLM